MKIANLDDTIEWTFEDSDYYPDYLRGNTFEAKVQKVDYEKKEYGVYAEYGIDYIPFGNCKIIKTK